MVRPKTRRSGVSLQALAAETDPTGFQLGSPLLLVDREAEKMSPGFDPISKSPAHVAIALSSQCFSWSVSASATLTLVATEPAHRHC